MMASTRVANTAFFRIDGNGRVISKDSITEPISSHLTGSYEQRVIEDSSNPSTLGYPTVKEYIEREALVDYVLSNMGPDAIITVEAGDSLATTFAFSTNADTVAFGFNLGGETAIVEYSDGTSLGPDTSFTHTWVPDDPPNSATSDFSHLALGGMASTFQMRNKGLISLQLPSDYVSNLVTLYIDSNVDLASATIPAEATSLQNMWLQSTSLADLTTHGTWPLGLLWIYNSLAGNMELQGDWPLVELRAYNSDMTDSISLPSGWGDTIELLQLHLNPKMTAIDIPSSYVNMESLSLGQNTLLTRITTHKEWVSLTAFSANIIFGFGGAGGTLETHKEWVALESIAVDRMGLTAFKVHPEWTSIQGVYVYSNALDAATIDQMLIDIEACGTSNGNFQYHNCPGSSDGDRSPAALTAKSTLQARGWSTNPA